MFYCLNLRNIDGNVNTMLIETELNPDEVKMIFNTFKKDLQDNFCGCAIQDFPLYLVRKKISFKVISPIKLFFTAY